jgi:Mg/Co/Ni transporter MgtE
MFFRVYVVSTDITMALALTVALFFIVMLSVLLGSLVPITLARMGLDPASGAGTQMRYIGDYTLKYTSSD